TARPVLCAVALVAAIASWIPSAAAFERLAYPPDVLYSLGIDSARVSASRKLCDFNTGTSYPSPAPLNRATGAPYRPDGDYVLVNFCQGGPARPATTDAEIDGQARLFDGPHWLSFPAYTFEDMP